MSRVLALLVVIMLIAGVVFSANAQGVEFEEMRDLILKGIPLDVTECKHEWRKEIVRKRTNSVTYQVLRQQTVDVGDYHAIYSYIMNECLLCGVCQVLPEIREEQHLYCVEEYDVDAANSDLVRITYRCELCAHVRIEPVLMSDLVSEAASAEAIDCRHGAECPAIGQYMEIEKGIQVRYDEWTWYLARVLVNENGQDIWKVARRLECWTCRRPYMQVRTEIDENWADFDSLPTMTYEEFMSEERDDLPYQLIDQLRKEAGAV